MKLGIRWNQPSTLRGLFGLLAGSLAIYFLLTTSTEKALAVMTIASLVQGYLGFAISDNGK